MKELYLTVTDMTFLSEGRVLGLGRTVTAAPGPERPGDLSGLLTGGVLRMGVFRPVQDKVPTGRWNALFEGQEGYSLTFRGDRFLLGHLPVRARAAKAGR